MNFLKVELTTSAHFDYEIIFRRKDILDYNHFLKWLSLITLNEKLSLDIRKEDKNIKMDFHLLEKDFEHSLLKKYSEQAELISKCEDFLIRIRRHIDLTILNQINVITPSLETFEMFLTQFNKQITIDDETKKFLIKTFNLLSKEERIEKNLNWLKDNLNKNDGNN